MPAMRLKILPGAFEKIATDHLSSQNALGRYALSFVSKQSHFENAPLQRFHQEVFASNGSQLDRNADRGCRLV